jgi:hypothetical protein
MVLIYLIICFITSVCMLVDPTHHSTIKLPTIAAPMTHSSKPITLSPLTTDPAAPVNCPGRPLDEGVGEGFTVPLPTNSGKR